MEPILINDNAISTQVRVRRRASEDRQELPRNTVSIYYYLFTILKRFPCPHLDNLAKRVVTPCTYPSILRQKLIGKRSAFAAQCQ